MRGELIYTFDGAMTGVTDFGVALDAILSGATPVPAQGARFDVGFEGRVTGRVAGRIRGIDHAYVRPDGRFELNLHAVIDTDDGARIAFNASGVGVLRAGEPVLDLSENVSLLTASEAYAWINSRQIWGVGTANPATGHIQIEAYLQ